jgi:glutathione S-transferase
MTDYTLHYAPDNASVIVRLALEEMGLPYRTVLVDRMSSQQKSPAYRQLNPAGMIPALETPQGVIFETAAILLWLADHHGQMAPSPDHPDRGDFLKWLFFTATNLQGGLRMTFYPKKFTGSDPAHQNALQTGMRGVLAQHLGILNALAGSGWQWIGQERPSLLDYYISTCLRWCALYPDRNHDWFALDRYPALRAMAQRLEKRHAVQAAQQAEGLGPTPFTAPQPCCPPEGSAL